MGCDLRLLAPTISRVILCFPNGTRGIPLLVSLLSFSCPASVVEDRSSAEAAAAATLRNCRRLDGNSNALVHSVLPFVPASPYVSIWSVTTKANHRPWSQARWDPRFYRSPCGNSQQ